MKSRKRGRKKVKEASYKINQLNESFTKGFKLVRRGRRGRPSAPCWCPKCGKRNEGRNFCKVCGTSLNPELVSDSEEKRK